MKIAVVQASSQISKNEMLFQYTKKYAKDSEVINFGCFENDTEKYSYLDIAVLIGLLINNNIVDFLKDLDSDLVEKINRKIMERTCWTEQLNFIRSS